MNKLFTKESFITSNWSGGKTTELFIFPLRSSLKQSNFDARISIASVEVDESEFTPLEGVSRTLMVLKGELELTHKNNYTKKLKQFECDDFEGGWTTFSKGKSLNFNLMLKNDLTGRVQFVRLEENDYNTYGVEESEVLTLIYLLEGALLVKTKKQDFVLEPENLLVLDDVKIMNFSSTEPAQFLIVRINKRISNID